MSEPVTTAAVVKVEQKPGAMAKAKNTDEVPISEAVKALMTSGLVKESESAGKVLAKISFGRSLGLSDVAAINGISFSPNGTLIMSAAMQLSLIKRSGKYRLEYKQRSDKVCEIQVYEKVDNEWFSCGTSCKFTWDDAVRAGLSNKQTYKLYPTQLLTARCISDVFRTHCSDVTNVAVYTPEEIPESGYRTDPESGEMVPDAEFQPKAPAKMAATATLELDEQVLKLVSETGADLNTLLAQYKVKMLAEATEPQLKSMIQVLRARNAAKPKQ